MNQTNFSIEDIEKNIYHSMYFYSIPLLIALLL